MMGVRHPLVPTLYNGIAVICPVARIWPMSPLFLHIRLLQAGLPVIELLVRDTCEIVLLARARLGVAESGTGGAP